MTTAEKVSQRLAEKDIKTFILGGRAIFTLKNEVTGNRRTYSVYRIKDPNKDLYFVNVRGDGESIEKNKRTKWIYVGMICDSTRPNSKFVLTTKSKVTKDSLAFTGFNWLWQKLVKGLPLHQDMSIYHEGRCGRCGRQLTDPKSILTGFGPECIKKAS